MVKGRTTARVLSFVKTRGIVRPRDLEAHGLPSALLYRLRDRGELKQVGRGLFMHPAAEITEKHSYAEAAKLVPAGVICLLSALAFHGIGTQSPREVWIAVERGAHRPRVSGLPLQVVWFSPSTISAGVKIHRIAGVDVKVFTMAKTIADLFKYRNKIGVDVAVEALKDGWEQRLFTMDELMRYARICRVGKVMRPYVEAIV